MSEFSNRYRILEQAKCEALEHDKATLVRGLEEEISNSLNSQTDHEVAVEALKNVEGKFDTLEANLNTLKTAKKLLEQKHEKVCTDFKNLKSKNDDLEKEIKLNSVALKNIKKEAKDDAYKHEKIVSNKEQKIQELLEFKRKKCSEEKDIKVKQKKIDKRLKNIHETEAKLKLAKVDIDVKPTKFDENENESQPDDHITPLVPVSNVFQIFSEVEQVYDNTIEKDITLEEDNIEEDKIRNENVEYKIEEALNKTKSKILNKMKISVHEKIRARPESDNLTDDEIAEIETELMDGVEVTLAEELEAWKQHLNSNFPDYSNCEGVTEHEDLTDEHGFYWGGEEELEIMFRDIDS